jgi:osomolarity two-component system phosphorelay intermediate protein YPD1
MSSNQQATSPEAALERRLGEDGIDMAAFGQILEMDDPGENEFSTSILVGFFEQAQQTLKDMDEALVEKDLATLSSQGHFLKGSSATLGLIKIRDGCEKIQCYGKNENPDGNPEPDDKVCLEHIADAIENVKRDYDAAETALKTFLEESTKDEDDA